MVHTFQFTLTSSNSADSLGSCLRISSPRKIFCWKQRHSLLGTNNEKHKLLQETRPRDARHCHH